MRNVKTRAMMPSARLGLRTPAILAAAAVTAAPVGAQTTRVWRNATSAPFNTPASWVGSTVPGPNDTAQFGLTSSVTPFTVTLPGNTTNASLVLTNQRPTFSLGGFTYTPTNGVTVSGSAGPALTVSGGTLTTGNNPIRLGNAAGQSGSLTVEAGSAVTGGLAAVGDNGGTGNLTVRGAGSVWTASALDTVRGGTGNIVVRDGGRLRVIGESNAAWTNSRQDWLVTGPGSHAELGNVVRVSDAQSASFRIENGGLMSTAPNGSFELANNANTSVTFTVDGANSRAVAGAFFLVGAGAINAQVLNGGSISTGAGFGLGGGYTSQPQTLLVRGTGSEVVVGDFPPTLGGDAQIGYEHTNVSVTIDQGGRFSANRNMYIGMRGQASVTVDGPNSTLFARYNLRVGWGGGTTGSLTVRNGASLSADYLEAADDMPADILIEGAGTLATAKRGGFGDAARVTVRNGAGLEFTEGGIGMNGVPTLIPELRIESGGYVFAQGRIDLGDNIQPTPNGAVVTLDGGDLITLDYVPINLGGIVRGVGTVSGLLSVSGTVSPGLPIGTLNATTRFDPPGRLLIDIGGTTPGTGHDVLAGDSAQLNGTLVLSVVNGFSPQPGQTFDVLTTTSPTGRIGQFAAVTGTDLGNGRAFVPSYLADRVRLTVDGVTGFDIAQSSVAVAQGFVAAPLTATAAYAASPTQTVTNSVTWTSDDTNVATVDSTGVIRGVSAGTTAIRGTFAGLTDTLQVTVRGLPGVAAAQPGLETRRYDPNLLEMSLLTPTSSGTRATPNFGSGELEQITGRQQWIGSRLTAQLIIPTTGTYTFHSGGGDIVAVSVNGNPVSWFRPFYAPYSVPVELQAGTAAIRFDFARTQGGGLSEGGFDWQGPGLSRRQFAPTDFIGGTLQASYFLLPISPLGPQLPDLNLYRPVERGTASNIDLPIFPNGYLGFRMQRFDGFLSVPDSATYTFKMNVDDAAQLWIDGNLVIDSGWSDFQFGTDRVGTRTLQRGVYPIRVDYTEHAGNFGGIQIRMSSPGIVEQIIPPAAFAFAVGTPCYPNCDGSTASPVLNALDFACFLTRYQSAQSLPAAQQVTSYANCDASTSPPTLNALDFACFLNRYQAGCP